MKKAKTVLSVLVLTLLLGGAFVNIVASAKTTTEPIKTIQRVDPPMP